MMTDRYPEFLRFVFDRPETPNGWYFDEASELFPGSANEVASFIELVLRRSSMDLASFTDNQVSYGLNFLFNSACSDTVHALKSDDVPEAMKLNVIKAFGDLYHGVFSSRCKPVLGHLSEPGGTSLNAVCYMLWDVTPLAHWEDHPHRQVFYEGLLSMLQKVLSLEHVACVESAIHGLGHLHDYCNEQVEAIISHYLSLAPPSPLRAYAERAFVGNIQ